MFEIVWIDVNSSSKVWSLFRLSIRSRRARVCVLWFRGHEFHIPLPSTRVHFGAADCFVCGKESGGGRGGLSVH